MGSGEAPMGYKMWKCINHHLTFWNCSALLELEAPCWCRARPYRSPENSRLTSGSVLHLSQIFLHGLQARKQCEREKKEKLQRALESGQQIIIDMDFADKMTGAEVRSLCQQLSYSYSVNNRAAQPAHLILTGYEVTSSPQALPLAAALPP